MTFTVSKEQMKEFLMCRNALAALAEKDIHTTSFFKDAINDWCKKNGYTDMNEAVDLQILNIMLSDIKARETMR